MDVRAICLICVLTGLPAAAAGGHDPPPTVPPIDEIVILDPGVDPEGKPRPIVRNTASAERPVDIPPTIIVHRYYYTGDREFQGPALPGGPTIVVVHHPKSGERLHLDVQFPPGAPRVRYRHDHIRYDYGRHIVELRFDNLLSLLPFCEPCPYVKYRHGPTLVQRVQKLGKHHYDHVDQWLEQAGIYHVSTHLKDYAVHVSKGSAHVVHTAGELIITPARAAADATPLGGLLRIDPQEQAIQARDQAVRRAGGLESSLDIPTNR